MKSIFKQILLITAFSISLPLCAYAHDEEKDRKVEGIAKDCEFLYILRDSKIEKFNLPNLTPISSVNLPARTRGEGIKIAGDCSDTTETILVFAKGKNPVAKKVLLSYDENLQLIGQLTLEEHDNDNDDDDDNDND